MYLEILTVASLVLNIIMCSTTTLSEALALSKCKPNSIIQALSKRGGCVPEVDMPEKRD